MNILVGVTYYPHDNKTYSGVFFHTRNKYYLTQNIKVTVINYNCTKDYVIDGIEVISIKTYLKRAHEWNVILCHAPDFQAYKFLKKYHKNFNKIFFFIHGNEVLRRNLYYHSQYSYVRKNTFLNNSIQHIRDIFKILIWRRMYRTLSQKSQWIFVSNWMYKEFQRNLKLEQEILDGRSHVIYNCIGDLFEKEKYNFSSHKEYDCVTIRGSLDSSKYAIDLVVNIAQKNPKNTFLLIGKGKYFNYYTKPKNLTVISENLSHHEIITYLLKAKIALMPTRHDAQGVMMCEMATFGIPVITSDIEVCHEVLNKFDNIFFIDNNNPNIDITTIMQKIVPSHKDIDIFYKDNTCKKEIILIRGY